MTHAIDPDLSPTVPPKSLVKLSLLLAAGLLAPLAAAVTDPGYPVQTRTPGDLLSDGHIQGSMGRLSTIAFHRGVLVTIPEGPGSSPGADLKVRSWDISSNGKLFQPVLLKDWGVPSGIHGPIHASHHHVVAGNQLHAGWWIQTDTYGTAGSLIGKAADLNWPDTFNVRSSLTIPWTCIIHPGYGSETDPYVLKKHGVQVGSWNAIAESTVSGHTIILGDKLLVVGNNVSRAGVATWDIADPANPRLLDVLKTGSGGRGIGGYWPMVHRHWLVIPQRQNELGGTGLKKAVQVVDISDLEDLRHVRTIELPYMDGYAHAQDEFVFVGPHKLDSRLWEDPAANPVVLTMDVDQLKQNLAPKGHFFNPNQFAAEYVLPIGNLIVTGGIAAGEGFTIWAHQAAPDTRGPEIANHWPKDGRLDFPVGAPITALVHEVLRGESVTYGDTIALRRLDNGSLIDAWAIWADTGVLTIAPKADLPDDTAFEVVFRAGGLRDVTGNVLVDEYRFTFSTGDTLPGNTAPDIDAITASPRPVAPGADLTVTVTASDAEGGLEYRIDPGDGSGAAGWQSGATFTIAYAAPGHYVITAQARDAGGLSATATTTVTVLTAPGGPMPRSSGPLAADPTRGQLWCVAPDNDRVARLSLANGSRLSSRALPAGSDPRAVAVDPASGEAWVTCHDSDRIQILSASAALSTAIDLPTGSRPQGIVIDSAADRAYVACQGSGELRSFAVSERSPQDVLDLGGTPRALALSGSGDRLLVTRFISPDSGGEVWDVATTGLSLTRTIVLGLSSAADNGSNGRGLPNHLSDVVISPDGQRAWVTAKKDNIGRGVFREGQDLIQDQTVRAMLAIIDLQSHTERFAERIDIDNSDSPVGLAFSPLGDWVFVGLQGNDRYVAYDALAIRRIGESGVVLNQDTGSAPQGVLVAGDRLWTHDFLARQVGHRSLAAFFADGTPPAASATTTALVDGEALDNVVLSGKRIFYHAEDPRMSAEGYISCASCHRDGGQDGRTWDFTGRGEGLRNTTSLRGPAGTGHGKVHWTANFDEIQDFEHDIRGPFGGSGFLSDADFATTADPLGTPKAGRSADLDALAAYVTSLDAATIPASPHRDSDGNPTPAAAAGEALFKALDCASCHSGAAFTDSASGLRHDVGTITAGSGSRIGGPLDGLDTPTLLGLHATAPYFHDGSATTIRAVLERSGPAHGDAASLSSLELEQLTAYLLQLDGSSSNPGSDNRDPVISAIAVDDNPVTGTGTRLRVTASDPDGDALGYLWAVVDRPADSAPSIASGEDPQVVFDRAGAYRFRVTVSDGKGGSAAATVDLSVVQTLSGIQMQP